MSDGFQFIDIIFFAMIAAFLVLRLRGALGRRDGHEGPGQNSFKDHTNDENKNGVVDDNIIPLIDRNDQPELVAGEAPPPQAAEDSSDDNDLLAKGILDVHAIDPNFDKDEFLSGAQAAFEIILSAYSSGDTPSLKPLLSADVFANFTQVIWDREQAKQTMEDTLVGITSAEIVEAFTESSLENITVKFVSEQVNVIREENGKIVDGDPNAVIETIDFWTFSRNSRSSNPNWTLVATNSLD
jgi:predicted lipid-binding transport protein (Tim44 family)